MKVSRRDIAAAVAAEIGRGDLWRAALLYEAGQLPGRGHSLDLGSGRLRIVQNKDTWTIKRCAEAYRVRVQDLERVIRGRAACK